MTALSLSPSHREAGVNDLLRLVERLWPYLIVLIPGVWALWLRWTDRAKGRVTQRAELIKIAEEAAGNQIGRLEAEIDRHRERIEELEAELGTLQRQHTQMIADKDAKIALLEGQCRQLAAQVAAYEELLERNNIPVPQQSKPYWTVEGGALVPIPTGPAAEGKP